MNEQFHQRKEALGRRREELEESLTDLKKALRVNKKSRDEG
jgi:hypothetical protein